MGVRSVLPEREVAVRSVIFAALAAVLVVACSADDGPVFRGDVRFSEAERAAIERGDVWLAERVGGRSLGVTWDLSPEEAAAAPTYAIVRGRSPLGIGHADRLGRVVLDADTVSLGGLEQLAAHELAHYRGIDHHPGPGLMSEDGLRDRLPEWTEEDAAACRAARACRR